jgi:hypothetical protein
VRRRRGVKGRKDEQGIVIVLVAVVLLFVVGAMAALSIDVVTIYTARSEAQLAADGAALAGARTLANSGMTSDPTALSDGLAAKAEALATRIADQVAMRNQVGGRTLFPANGEVLVTFNDNDPSFATNPRVTVVTKRADLPTFFARIWGSTAVTVQASATAEVYNPSGAFALNGTVVPVAPTCVKPLVLPNISPHSGGRIIDPSSGAIVDTGLLGADISSTLLQPLCVIGSCRTSTLGPQLPSAWHFYPGDQPSFPASAGSLPVCAASFNSYQQSVTGCVQTPIACGDTVSLETPHLSLHPQTADAVNCLTHASASGEGDSIDIVSGVPTNAPYQFLPGSGNPLVIAGTLAQSTDVMVSDSLATLPIYNSTGSVPPSTVTVIGFVQVFLNEDGNPATQNGIETRVINIAGCGSNPTGQPILGNGASPVPVRLITPP